MSHGGRLRALRVRVHGENGFGMPRGESQERPPQIQSGAQQRKDELALTHAVHRHIDVVAAARGMQASGNVLSAGRYQQTLDIEIKIFGLAVVGCVTQFIERNRIERFPNDVCVEERNDVLRRQHHEMRVVNRHQRMQEERFGVFEIVVENGTDVLRSEPRQAIWPPRWSSLLPEPC